MKKEKCMTNQTEKETTQEDRDAERLDKKKVNMFCTAAMNYYGPECDFMSLTIIAGDGNVFYAQFTDYNAYRVDDPAGMESELLFGVDETKTCADVRETLGIKPDDKKSCVCLGSKEDIRKLLLAWLNDIYGECSIRVVSAFSSGLYVLTGLYNLFGGIKALPKCLATGGAVILPDNILNAVTVEWALSKLDKELTTSQRSATTFFAASLFKCLWQH